MAKSWKPKLPKAFQPYKPPKPFDPFKIPTEPKEEPRPHVMTEYERQLIQTLCPIIKNKQLIKFWYADNTTSNEDWRIVEPHLIGQTKFKAANIGLRAWFLPTPEQIYSGYEEGWKLYTLDDIKKVEILSQTFIRTRPSYNPQDKNMKTIFCATAQRMI